MHTWGINETETAAAVCPHPQATHEGGGPPPHATNQPFRVEMNAYAVWRWLRLYSTYLHGEDGTQTHLQPLRHFSPGSGRAGHGRLSRPSASRATSSSSLRPCYPCRDRGQSLSQRASFTLHPRPRSFGKGSTRVLVARQGVKNLL